MCSDLPKVRRLGRRRPKEPDAPETHSLTCYARIPRCQIVMYRFILESYDNLAVMSVVDRFQAVIKVRYTKTAALEVRTLLHTLGAELLDVSNEVFVSFPGAIPCVRKTK